MTVAARRVLTDPDLHTQMAAAARARAARARAVGEFDIDRIVPRYEAYYEDVIAAQKAAA